MVGFLDRHVTKQDRQEIVDAIVKSEKMTSGEVRVHLQKKCKEDVLCEAQKTFHRLQMHKTRRRNAVLVFLALESRRFAILGDQGIHDHVGDSFWNATRDKMNDHFSKGQIKEGIIAGVLSIGEKLKAYFPSENLDKDELSNEVTGG